MNSAFKNPVAQRLLALADKCVDLGRLDDARHYERAAIRAEKRAAR